MHKQSARLLTRTLFIFFLLQQSISANPELYTMNEFGQFVSLPDFPRNSVPILFVHGHKLCTNGEGPCFDSTPDNCTMQNGAYPDSDSCPNFVRSWFSPRNDLTSFSLTLIANNYLNIEPYFIRFHDQNRSITEDATAIEQAVDIILARHNDNYQPNSPSSLRKKLAIIAYSKGTISTRLYLKRLYPPTGTFPDVLLEEGYNLPNRGTRFKPVSEFIAIAPPNHGLTAIETTVSGVSMKQLNNGYTRDDCNRYFTSVPNNNSPDMTTNFISELNGHPMEDTHASATALGSYDSEAPGSRSQNRFRIINNRFFKSPLSSGILYATLYAASQDDNGILIDDDIFVGGANPIGTSGSSFNNADCTYDNPNPNSDDLQQGRKLAINLATDAINTSVIVPWEPNDNLLLRLALGPRYSVHTNTVHTCEVIYRALYTAIHHITPSSINDACPSADSIPIIPAPRKTKFGVMFDGDIILFIIIAYLIWRRRNA